MRETEFKRYLRSLGLQGKALAEMLSCNYRNERYLGYDLDTVVIAGVSFDAAKYLVSIKQAQEQSPGDCIAALQYYYDFCLANPYVAAPRRNTRTPRANRVPLPALADLHGPDGNDLAHGVTYDPWIPDAERVTGLSEFVGRELEFVLRTAEDIPLGNDCITPTIHLCDERALRNQSIDLAELDKIRGRLREISPDEREDRDDNRDGCDRDCDRCDRDRCSQRVFNWALAPIWGTFDADRNLITIYYNNVIDASNTQKEFWDTIAMVLAHEYMHAYHFAYAGYNFHGDGSLRTIFLQEGIANFFAFWHLIKTQRFPHDRRRTANKRRNAWKRWLTSGWPYAAALLFFLRRPSGYHLLKDPGSPPFIKFCRILDISAFSWSDAFDELFRIP